MKTVVRMVSTFFYAGYVPKMPGTAGSAAGVVLFLLTCYSAKAYFIALVLVTAAGLLVIKEAEEIFGKKDSRKIVIDEVTGMMIALMFVPANAAFIALSFVFFRIFDVAKPFPIKRIEKMESPWGVILDDVAAGVYANIAVQLIAILALKRGV